MLSEFEVLRVGGDEMSSAISLNVSVSSQAISKRPLRNVTCPSITTTLTNNQHNIISQWEEILLSVWSESPAVARVLP